MEHVTTKKIAPTDTSGAKIRAKSSTTGRQITISYPYDANDPHVQAVHELMGATGAENYDIIHQGETPTGHRYFIRKY